MKKLIFVLLGALFLAGCGSEDASTSKPEETNKNQNEEVKEEVTLSTAQAGDKVTNEWGTYTIEKVAETNSSHESGPIKFNLNKVLLATFVPNESGASLFDEKKLNVAITLVESENTSEDTVTFDPFSAKVTTNTKGQYEAQSGLNEGDSEHIGNVKQQFTTAYNLKDEDLSKITELNFVFGSPSKDARSIGEDTTVKVSF
ncbi:membrane lipoprotein lipid attachment site-containing protein [Bacillus sp. FJAT-52991]|uniref:Membrane lipoprotein lipid attachment site-containing protein n=1 Tax=Bacillus kandeliae TaxID=3129297 RepID=A0ABZ2N2R2_9BACI